MIALTWTSSPLDRHQFGYETLKTFELRDASLSSLFSIIERQPAAARYIYRGQRDSLWSLAPGLYRRDNVPVAANSLKESFDYYESMAIGRFFSEGSPYLPPLARSYSNDRVLAQHFGVQTRLLDWSRDPLVALYFAVESYDFCGDSAVFMILPDAAFRPEEVKSYDNYSAIELNPPAIDRRIPAQKSTFTFHPYGPVDEPFQPLDKRTAVGNKMFSADQRYEHGFAKIIVREEFRLTLLHKLMEMGIDRRNLFPGLSGVGEDVSMRMSLGRIS